ncbi:transcription repressor NadR [Streptococcus sp. CSL10205-OR2]|uniref:transcription repressor NadR n=1 Tax=Streptococcus sp. CSL10205-OR2 TaxID=2980558 RepID=UPI0021D97464|nr:transcription repressor NadR [Streptococcus sp. CSL10205-OR2]MCU9533031.1 transcription repressor NadR [Streptococcus sp. CSL10205-OR2]
MKATQRRDQIVAILKENTSPISATKLAKELGVSRQVIVGDIALLRASNIDIMATHRGYLLVNNLPKPKTQYIKKIACQHSEEEVAKELDIIVSGGGQVLDVEIEHPLYGILTATLNIATKDDIKYFTQQVKEHQGALLSHLTHGIHNHTISCPSKEVCEKILEILKKENILLT